MVIVRSGSWTLGRSKKAPPYLRECPVKEVESPVHPRRHYGSMFENIEGKVGLIVYVRENRLKQPMGYRVLIEGLEMFCKSKVANKYFKLVETDGDESRGSSAF